SSSSNARRASRSTGFLTGTSRTTGWPCRVRTISSPASARRTSSVNCALASVTEISIALFPLSEHREFGLSDSPIQGSLPLDRAGGFGGDVVDDAVDAADFVDDAGRGAAEKFVRERQIVGGHAVGRGHCAQGADEIIRPAVAHDADAPHRQQYGEGLPDRIVE